MTESIMTDNTEVRIYLFLHCSSCLIHVQKQFRLVSNPRNVYKNIHIRVAKTVTENESWISNRSFCVTKSRKLDYSRVRNVVLERLIQPFQTCRTIP